MSSTKQSLGDGHQDVAVHWTQHRHLYELQISPLGPSSLAELSSAVSDWEVRRGMSNFSVKSPSLASSSSVNGLVEMEMF